MHRSDYLANEEMFATVTARHAVLADQTRRVYRQARTFSEVLAEHDEKRKSKIATRARRMFARLFGR